MPSPMAAGSAMSVAVQAQLQALALCRCGLLRRWCRAAHYSRPALTPWLRAAAARPAKPQSASSSPARRGQTSSRGSQDAWQEILETQASLGGQSTGGHDGRAAAAPAAVNASGRKRRMPLSVVLPQDCITDDSTTDSSLRPALRCRMCVADWRGADSDASAPPAAKRMAV